MAFYDTAPWTNYFQGYILTGNAAGTKERTLGGSFALCHPGRIGGVRFYSARSGVHTVRAAIWLPGDASGSPTLQADVDCDGPREYTAGFDYEITDAHLAAQVTGSTTFSLGLYDPTETEYTYSSDSERPLIAGMGSPGRGYIMSPNVMLLKSTSNGLYRPDTAGPGVVIGDVYYLPQDDNDREPTPWSRIFGQYNANIAALAGSRTVGTAFRIMGLCSIIGVRFYTHVSGSHTIRASVWRYDTLAQTYVDVPCSGPGAYEGIFSAPIVCDTTLLAASGNTDWWAGVWETGGSYYTVANSGNQPWSNSPHISWNGLMYRNSANSCRLYAAGDARPTTTGAFQVPVDPIVVPNFAYFNEPV